MGGILQGRRIVVTGAARGLGRSICTRVWAEGGSVVGVTRTGTAATELRAALGPAAPGQTFEPAIADLAWDPQRLERELGGALASAGPLHGLVNNAAVLGPMGPAWESDPVEWSRTLAIDLLAPVALCRLCVPLLAKAGGGAIVNLSGGGATSPRPGFSAYAAAKTALVRFSETLAVEASALGVRVNCVAPGAMPTDMLQAVLDAGPAVGMAEASSARKAFAGGDDVMGRAAGLVVFLLSEVSLGITGRLLSAVWDRWERLPARRDELATTDVYTLRRIVPGDRGKPDWEAP